MRRTLVAVMAAATLLGGACAQEADESVATVGSGDALGLLQQAPALAQEAGTNKFEMTMDMSMPEVGSFTMTGTGAADYDAQLVHMEMDMSEMLDELGGLGEPLPFDELTMEVLVTSEAMFMRSQMFGDKWIRMSFEDLTGGALNGEDLFSQGMNDPSAYLEFLRGAGGEPDVLGREQVRGVDTTHYASEFTMADSLAAAPEEQREALERALEYVPSQVADQPIAVEVWIGDDGLARRMQMDMGAMLGDVVPGDGEMIVTMEMFDFGEPVDIEVPDDADTMSMDEMMDGFGEVQAPVEG